MNSKCVLLGVAVLWLGTAAYAQAKKVPIKNVKGSVKKKTITEHEAKRMHEVQMMKEGHMGVRKAYKRSDMVLWENTETVALEEEKVQTPKPAMAAPKPQSAPAPQPVATKAAAPPQPRFIESIVLERKEG